MPPLLPSFRALAFALPWLLIAPSVRAQRPLATTLEDFYLQGSQHGAVGGPGSGTTPIVWPFSCASCHTDVGNGDTADHFRDWSGSMMAQAGRDPLFFACLQIANDDAAFAGDICLRCHMPGGWLAGRSVPTDGSAMTANDRQGVSCNFCHRMIAPAPGADECYTADPSCIDGQIRYALSQTGDLPYWPGNGSYVVDPVDRRRGPFADALCGDFHGHEVRGFFKDSALCGTCHDVSNPAFVKAGNDYVLTPAGQRHPTGDKYQMFPLERTYSEWLLSSYAQPGGVDSGGRFGGNNPVVGSCQSCHMPRGRGDQMPLAGCFMTDLGVPLRMDQPMHYFAGANTWMPDVIANLYPGEVDYASMLDNKLRSMAMLQNAATLQLSLASASALRVRVINETGHKLPTGYPEGRRMWLRVVIRDCSGAVVLESGHYDGITAELNTQGAKIYEAKHGLDAAMAAAAGLPAGESFHMAINNKIVFDNRIPPRGYHAASFRLLQAEPVGYNYANGQYWDDTTYPFPGAAATAQVQLYYQTASKEYIEFLKNNNARPYAENFGWIVHDQWEITGKSPPVLMAEGEFAIRVPGDLSGDRQVTAADLSLFVNLLLSSAAPDACARYAVDFDDNGRIDGDDIGPFLATAG